MYLSRHIQIALAAAFLISNGTAEVTRMLISDEGKESIFYVNLENPEENWTAPIDTRDMQLIGNNRLLVSNGVGYAELDLATGEVVKEATTYRISSARRTPDGHTWLLSGGGTQAYRELGENDVLIRELTTTGYKLAYLMRETLDGTFVRTHESSVIEVDTADGGTIIWSHDLLENYEFIWNYMACKLANGNYLIAGERGILVEITPEKEIVREIPSSPHGDSISPKLFAGFQILDNGNIVVSNWIGHGTDKGHIGRQILEYDADGNLVWAFKQDPDKFSSIHNVIVLDGLDTEYLHMQYDGTLKPVGAPPGCMDPVSPDYNENATEDDGSCSYAGCMDSASAGYFCTEHPDAFPCTGIGGYTLADVSGDNSCQVGTNFPVKGNHYRFSNEALMVTADFPYAIEVRNVHGEIVHSGTGSRAGEYRYARIVPEPGMYVVRLTFPEGTVNKSIIVF
jgi:hypothetical protein